MICRGDDRVAHRRATSISWAFTVAAVMTLSALGCLTDSSRDEITIIEHSWESASVQSQIVGYIVEHGYGYPVSTLLVDPLAIDAALSSGSADVAMEIWLPNNREIYDEVIEDGTAVDIGKSIEDSWQGFGVPQYVKDANPGLGSVGDIRDYVDVFATVGSDGKVRFVDCVPGWACEVVNSEKWLGYGLNDIIHSVKPGSEAALLADLKRAYSRGDAWFGYVWGPSIISIDYEMYVLTEPEYTAECWESDKACSYPITEVKKLAASGLVERAPDVVDFLRQWHLPTEALVEVSKWMADNHETSSEGAIYFLQKFPHVWRAYVPDQVATKVETAVASNG